MLTRTCFILLAVSFSSLGFNDFGEESLTEKTDLENFQDSVKADEDRIFAHILQDDRSIQAPIPTQYDWRSLGVISPVKNQGELGSSVALAAEECVESLNAIQTRRLLLLSPAEVQDCCGSRLIEADVFDCISESGGLCGEQAYPMATGICRNESCAAEVKIMGGMSVPSSDVTGMVMALLVRPLLVFVDASRTSFQTYSGGIYSDPDCSMDQVDHAMQVVGYGEEDGKEFWICKNSFGVAWGEGGYIRITKGNNMCGIESFVSYPF